MNTPVPTVGSATLRTIRTRTRTLSLDDLLDRTHAGVDFFSLRLHEEVAKVLDASGVAKARANIARWKHQYAARNAVTQPDWDVWLTILDRPLEDIVAMLVAETEEGDRLRQSSPFCGILSQAYRLEIFREVYHTPKRPLDPEYAATLKTIRDRA